MDRLFALAAALAAGLVIAFQAPANLGLGTQIGVIRAAFLSFVLGAVALGVVAVVVTGGVSIGITRDRVWWHYLGGFAGAFLVVALIYALRPLGATLQVAGVILGQTIGAVLIDRYGLFGVARRSIGVSQLAGVALILVGVVVVARG
jgi:bacterial/archaeal transporter family-2 protein